MSLNQIKRLLSNKCSCVGDLLILLVHITVTQLLFRVVELPRSKLLVFHSTTLVIKCIISLMIVYTCE